jgi:AAA ATPase domain
MVPAMPTAQTLSEAIDVLTPEPLDEAHDDWYVGNPTNTPGGHLVYPLGMLRASLLRARDTERLFLSGHIGAGKSTELRRLLRDPAIRRRYFVVDFRLADEEIPEVTSTHLLFIIAAELYQRANAQDLLKRGRKRWEAILKRIDERFFGQKGVSKEGSVDLKFNLLFMELRQQLKLVDSKRKEFRSFAESETTILVDLINALAEDIQLTLLEQTLPERVLVVIDDIDKIRSASQIDELFNKNLALLRAPRIPMLMTLPADITFGGPTTELGSNITHIRPAQVLDKTKTAATLDPLAATDPVGTEYLRRVLAHRVRDGLFDADVVWYAAVYSGGVLRAFFELLRNAAIRAADLYGLATVNSTTFNDQLEDEKNNLARATYPADRAALAEIHRTHELPDRTALGLMTASLVLEYNHAGIWWEANPLLWHVLK